MSIETYSDEDRFTPEELARMDAAQQESEKHQYDHIDPWEKLADAISCVDEAKSYLESATSNLMDAQGAAESCKIEEFVAGLELIRTALEQSIAATSAIQPNSYLQDTLKRWQEEQSRREDEHDAGSW